jgi:GT2 family glycosyltransferase
MHRIKQRRQDTAMPRLSIIVINFRTCDLTLRCVRSILAHEIAAIRDVIIVDNKSDDDSVTRLAEAFPDAQLVASSVNDGFGAGVNLGLQRATGEFVLVLNADTYFEHDSVSGVLEFMSADPDIGVAGLDLVNPDGSRQYSARRFYSILDIAGRRVPALGKRLSDRIDRHLMKEKWKEEVPFDAEWVMGTGFVIRHDLFSQLGGMDESYFLYLEDVDLCARVWRAGFRVVCVPKAELVHDHQRSSVAGPLSTPGRRHLRSLVRFAQKFSVPLFRQPGVDGISRAVSSNRLTGGH